MRIVHEPTAGGKGDRRRRSLAANVEVADSLPEKIRGLRFRRSIPDDYALVFPFDGPGRRDVDMLFVPFPIDVLWLVDDRVERASTLRPWIGFGIQRAETLVELPAGAADGVDAGDRVRIEDANGGV